MHLVRFGDATSPSSYLYGGSGPGAVLVHGTGATPEANFTDLMEHLERDHTVVAPYLVDPSAPSTAALARQVLAAADHAGLDTFTVVGHSLGASVAATAAALAPGRVHTAVLHAGWARTDPRMALQFDLWRRLVRHDPDLLARLVRLTGFSVRPDTTAGPQEEREIEEAVASLTGLFHPETIEWQTALDQELDIQDLLPRVAAHTLVISGTQDTIVPPAHQEEMARLIPDSSLVRVDHGHAFPFEAPAEFVRLVCEFAAAPVS